MRNKIFISHAAPDDNDFTKWLALKLISLGHEVWCDVLFLDKGADFWKSIDDEIRNHAIKFLIVSTSISVQREGVLKELAVAEKVKKKLQDDKFIIPLLLDKNLSYDDLPPEIIRLNAIDFKASWGKGLADLLDAFDKQKVPKDSPDPSKSNALYNQIFLYNRGTIDQEEVYDSNWFPITSFPEELRFHKYEWRLPSNFDVRTLTFPAVRFKEYLCTFAWEYDFMHQLPKTETYSNSETIRIPTKDILSGNIDESFIKNSEAQRIIVQLINMAFSKFMSEKDLRHYAMSNRTAYWIEKDKLEKDKFEKVQLVGKQKKKNWHFGISGAAKLYPLNVLMISSHIFFTEDGNKLIESTAIQHSSRRKQGRSWWNDKWRTKLLAFVKYLSENDNLILEVGSEEKIIVSNSPIQFKGQKSYLIPEKNNLSEESELADMSDTDEDDQNEETGDSDE
jgi:hypothetical protein